MVDILSTRHRVPDRPNVDVLSQLSLFYLVGATGERTEALSLLAHLCGEDGRLSTARLSEATTDLLEKCPADRAETALSGLRAVGEIGAGGDAPLDERCRRNPQQGRKWVAALPGMSQQRADWILLSVGALPTVAPTAVAMQVATRLGYPGRSYDSIARSLDAELPGIHGDGTPPGPEALDLAWRAHHLLDRHGRILCGPVQPSCASCALRESCAYRGQGDDPAARIEGTTESKSSFPPRARRP